MADPFRVVALLSAYNEGDVIGPVVGHLVEQGVEVYLLDHGSTDDTVARVEGFQGRGLIAVERFPEESGLPPEEAAAHPWRSILRRKEELAQEIEADWFLHHDADELRESPWAELTLAEAFSRVDRLGFNAIDFEVLEFVPTSDSFLPGADPREAFPFWQPPEEWNRVQVKGWKRLSGPLDLASSGGHEAVFPGRRVFPIRFLLRHYPIRGQEHGERKVFRERRPRLVAAERETEGWHRQYDRIEEGHRFVRSEERLHRFDPEQVRLGLLLHHRDVERLSREATGEAETVRELSSLQRRLDQLEEELDRALRATDRLGNELAEALHGREGDARRLDELLRAESAREAELDRARRQEERLGQELDRALREEEHLGQELDRALRDEERLGRELDRALREEERLGQELDRAYRERECQQRELAETERERARLETEQGELLAALRSRDGDLVRLGAELAAAEARRSQEADERRRLAGEVERRTGEAEGLRATVDEALARIEALETSKSWRWTAPLRSLWSLLGGRG